MANGKPQIASRGKRVFPRSCLGRVLVVAIVVVLGIGLWLYFWLFHGIPLPEQFGAYLSPSSEYSPVSLSEVPEALQWATVVAEDRTLYERSRSLNLKSIIRAVYWNFVCARSTCLRDGSTLPQGVWRSVMDVAGKLDTSQLRRDMRELAWMIVYERRYTPDEILGFYLNIAPYGEEIYGVEAAAQHYFGKHVRDLSLAECVVITVSGKYPLLIAEDWELVKPMHARILQLMAEEGYISEQVAKDAAQKAVVFVHRP